MYPTPVPQFGGRSRHVRLSALLALPALLLTLVASPGTGAAQPAVTAPDGGAPEGVSLSAEAELSAELAAEHGVMLEWAVLEELDSEGATDFWVVFDDKADLSGAYETEDWAERGQYVYDQLTTTAQASQAGLIEELTLHGVEHEPFWISNTVLVRDGDPLTLNAASTRSGVAEIRADETFEVPDPFDDEDDAETDARISAVEWGIANIRADQVWDDFGVHGEGIVVGSIDTGVEYTHPVLAKQYRGNNGDGTFDHDYNWWDPSQVCGSPSSEPCDNNGHGTHTTGTMVGADGAGNEVGVAPRAQWIAAKGCESSSCSQTALLSAGQFMLAPTDLSGENPHPELRPNIVNNSWGTDNGSGITPYYRDTVTAWTAAGIFGVFSNGNYGSGCDTTGSPADLVESWGVGAYDSDNEIASFSSRGPGENGMIRPSISAPGVSVRSSYPGEQYANGSGTSMAAPHQSGAVALMWSAAPALLGNIDQTRQILAETAIDTEDLQCGGTAENNNVYGQGRLDAYAAVEASPRGPAGTLTGDVTDSATNAPIADATVSFEVGGFSRSTTTDEDGTYTFAVVPVGTYEVAAEAFGYAAETEPAEIAEDQTTTRDFTLDAVPSHPVSGTVTDDRGDPPALGATVTIVGTPIPPAFTDAEGHFTFDTVPEGAYTLTVTSNGCLAESSVELVVDGPATRDVQLDQSSDDHGHTCRLEPADWIEATDPLPPFPPSSFGLPFLAQPLQVDLPFVFPFYDAAFTSAYVANTGFVAFLEWPDMEGGSTPFNVPLPDPHANNPNAAIYAFWDQLLVQYENDEAEVLTGTFGEEGSRQFVIEWRDAYAFGDDGSSRWDFQVVLHESGEVVLQYRNIDPNNVRERGGLATVGIENTDGTDALQFSFDQPVLSDNNAIRFTPPPGSLLTGAVTGDTADEVGVGNVMVTATDGETTVSTRTSDDGLYGLPLPPGTWTVDFERLRYVSETHEVTSEIGVTRLDVALRTAGIVNDLDEIDITLFAGEQQTFETTMTNNGSATLDWRAFTTQGQWSHAPGDPVSPGEVLASWPVEPADFAQGPNGIAYADGTVWLSLAGSPAAGVAREYTLDGIVTGREISLGTRGDLFLSPTSRMSFDAVRGWLCLSGSFLGEDNRAVEGAIICVDPDTGEIMDTLAAGPPGLSGPTYNPDDDVFYITYNRGEDLYQIAGFSHPTPGETLSHCRPGLPDQLFTGLAYSRATNTLWRTMWDDTRLVQLDPDDCSILATLETEVPVPDDVHPTVRDVSLDDRGNLWMNAGSSGGTVSTLYLIESGVPEVGDLPWLAVDATVGSVEPGSSEELTITVDTGDLVMRPGIYTADVVVASNAGRHPRVTIPVRVEIRPDGEDLIPPTVWASLDGELSWDGGWVYVGGPDKSVTVTLSAHDNYEGSGVDGVEYRLNDGEWADYDEPVRVSEPAEHTVSFRAADHAGNTSDEGSEEFTIAAGKLAADPDTVEINVPLGESVERTVTIANTGTRPVSMNLLARTPADASARIASHPGAPASELQWVDLPDLPVQLSTSGAAVVGGKVYVFGGSSPAGDRSDEVYMLDTGGEQGWVRLSDMPEPRGVSPATEVIDGKVYLAGGGIPGRDAPTLIYDPAADSWSMGADLPGSRGQAGSAVLDGQMYVIGGAGADRLKDVWRYDSATDSWERLADYPEPIMWHSCGAIEGQIYCTGGLAAEGRTTRTYVYNPADDDWQPRADRPGDRIFASSQAVVDGQLLVAGGTRNQFDGDATTNAAYSYHPDDDDWSELPAANHARYNAASAFGAFGDSDCGFYLLGGRQGSSRMTSVEVLTGLESCEPMFDFVPWLKLDPTSATLEPEESVDVTASLDASKVSEPGTYTAEIVVYDDTSFTMDRVTVTMIVEATPVTFDGLRERVEAFEADGDVTKAGAARLLAALREAEHHHERGSDSHAIRALEQFQSVAGDPKFVPSEAAREALVADAEQLIAQLRASGSNAGGDPPALVPGLESVPV